MPRCICTAPEGMFSGSNRPCQFLRRVAALCRAVCLHKVEMFFRPLRKIAQHQICTVCPRRFRQPFIHQGADVVVGVNESDPVPRRMVNADIPRVDSPRISVEIGFIRLSPAASASSISHVLSVDPFSTAMISISRNVLPVMELMHRSMYAEPLYTGTITLIIPCPPVRTGDSDISSSSVLHTTYPSIFSGAAPLHGVCARFSQYSALSGCLQSLHHGLLVKLGV